MRKRLLFSLKTDIVLLSRRLDLIIEGNYNEMLIRDKDNFCTNLGSRLEIKYLQIPQGEIIPEPEVNFNNIL
jgi:hypothetical protein